MEFTIAFVGEFARFIFYFSPLFIALSLVITTLAEVCCSLFSLQVFLKGT